LCSAWCNAISREDLASDVLVHRDVMTDRVEHVGIAIRASAGRLLSAERRREGTGSLAEL
jgi:hypothetical protein